MFKVLDRYLLKTFFKAALVSIFVFLMIYLIIDVIENIDDYIDNQANVKTVVRYYIYYFPFIIVQVMPVAVLLGSMFAVGLMARRNELLAISSSGISLYRVAQPLLLGGLLISVGMYFFSDRILPEANRRKTEIRYVEIEKNTSYGQESIHGMLYLGEQGRIFKLGFFQPSDETAKRVEILTIKENRLKKQVDCEEMQWEDTVWLATDGVVREFSADGDTVAVERVTEFDSLYLTDVTESPERFEHSERIRKGTDKNLGFDMSVAELERLIEYRKQAGVDTRREEVYYQIKYSLPITNFIIVLLAVPLASDKRRGSVAIGFAFAAGITFAYILLFEVGRELGFEGTIPPYVASWGVNTLFTLVGVVLMWKARK
jgi:lipopolysaccharide export system permease protein